jgi:hypothetical protein
MVGNWRYSQKRDAASSSVWLGVSSAYFFFHFLFLVFLGRITAFGIDEDGYLAVFRKIYSPSFDMNSQLSWPANNVIPLQLIHLPAKFISVLGVPDYLAIRIQSTILFYLTCWVIFKQVGAMYRKTNIALISVFMFLPSIFVWTSLGLRESYIFFWITLIWLSLHKLIGQYSRRYLFILFLSMNGLATTKIYLYSLAFFVSVVVLILLLRSKGFKELILVFLVVLSPLFILPGVQAELITSARSAILSETVSGTGVNGSGTGVNGSGTGVNGSGTGVNGSGTGVNGSGTGVNEASEGLTLKLLLVQLEGNALLKSMLSRSGILDRLNAVALDIEPVRESVVVSNDFENGSLTNVSELLLAVVKFLVLPIPFADNGTYFVNLQSIESPILYSLYFVLLWFVIAVLRRKPEKTHLFFGLCCFAVLFMIQSALVEINLGTLVRHRSILILIILLACVEASTRLSSLKINQIQIKS